MKPKFITALRYLILFLTVLNTVNLAVFGFAGKLWFGYQEITGTGGYTTAVFLTITSVLTLILSYEFLEPKNVHMWITLILVWLCNIFTVLLLYGFISFGEVWDYATLWIVGLITMIINTFVFFPYEAFQKHEAKPQ